MKMKMAADVFSNIHYLIKYFVEDVFLCIRLDRVITIMEW